MELTPPKRWSIIIKNQASIHGSEGKDENSSFSSLATNMEDKKLTPFISLEEDDEEENSEEETEISSEE